MKTFKQYLIDAAFPPEFTPDPQYKNGNVLVTLDVDKFEKRWKQNKDMYVGPSGSHNAMPGRYERFQNFLKHGFGDGPIPIETPIIWVNIIGEVGIDNGRHRYAVLRDLGMKFMPVLISKPSLKYAKKYELIKEI